MNIEEKNTYIKENTSTFLSVINSFLDTGYDIKEKFFENGEKKEGLSDVLQLDNFFKNLDISLPKYEALRKKIVEKEDLNLMEINLLAAAVSYIRLVFIEEITSLEEAIKESDAHIKNLMSE